MAKTKVGKYGSQIVDGIDIQPIKIRLQVIQGYPGVPGSLTYPPTPSYNRVVNCFPDRPTSSPNYSHPGQIFCEFDNSVFTREITFDGYNWLNNGFRALFVVHDPDLGDYKATMDAADFYKLIKENTLVNGRTFCKFYFRWNGQFTSLVYVGV